MATSAKITVRYDNGGHQKSECTVCFCLQQISSWWVLLGAYLETLDPRAKVADRICQVGFRIAEDMP